jgi:ubiquinone/menaquinone biosynthesis C-methylase UbiE
MSESAARRFFDSADPARWGREEMPEAARVTAEWIARANADGPSLEVGCGRGALAGVAAGYVGVDLAFVPLLESGKRHVQADAGQLPFASNTFGFAFTWAALEHVPNPDKVLLEIERVLRPGGVALLAPAWHCRSWAAEGLEFRAYSALTFTQRIRKALIPFRNAIAWRALFELPQRVFRELRRTREFEYARLQPNLEQYVGTDCDAFTSMDPHAAAIYFAARGWEVLSHPTLRERMLARHEPVVVRKPDA